VFNPSLSVEVMQADLDNQSAVTSFRILCHRDLQTVSKVSPKFAASSYSNKTVTGGRAAKYNFMGYTKWILSFQN
jgi:hypothetical protein